MRSIHVRRAWSVLMAVAAAVSLAVVSCTPQSPPPPPTGDGPQFVINSPQDGAQVAGPVFFSVQPLDPSEVQSVTFTVDGTELGADDPGETLYKRFLVPGDFAAGSLSLSATVTGNNGRSRTRTITVENVPNPPGSTTVGAGGAVLGSVEENGATSTLTIPPGVGTGAAVTFEARTEAEVLAGTGVDYDALGVTFLGAQEITSDRPLDGPLGVTSGGFGPQVQPGQTIVNYRIAPDSDNDGVGELVVMNTATVAPNGDVISDPISQIVLGAATVTTSRGTSRLRTLQGMSGPPGSIIEVSVTGFNPNSALGNVADWTCPNGTTIRLPGLVRTDPANPGMQLFTAAIPVCPPGTASVILRNLGTGASVGPIAVTITPPRPLGLPADQVIDNNLQDLDDTLSEIPTPEEQPWIEDQKNRAAQEVDEARQRVQDLAEDPTPEEEEALEDTAEQLQDPEIDFPDDPTGGEPDCLTAEAKEALRHAIIKYHSLAFLWEERGEPALAADFENLANRLAAMRKLPTCGEPDDTPAPGPSPNPGGGDQTGGAQPAPSFTGMGSGIPPGGTGYGDAPASGGPSGGSLRTAAFGDMAGRVVVKIRVGSSSVPFSGVTDAGGYFFIPFLPAGLPFEAVAIDTVTRQVQTVAGIGPPVGESVYLFFDFFSAAGSAPGDVNWDGGGDGSSWSDPLNWDTDALPGPSDNVVIDVPGDVTVTHSSAAGTTTINSLDSKEDLVLAGGTLELAATSKIEGDFTVSGGTLGGSGDLTVTGTLMFTGGIMEGLGTVVVPAGAILEFAGPALKTLKRSLDNAGTVNWREGSVWSGNGAIFTNRAGAVFDILTDGDFNGDAFSIPLTLNNDGLLRKSGGTGVSEFRGTMMTSNGTIEVQTGTLRNWFTNSTIAGALTGSGDGKYQSGSGSHTFEGTSSISLPNFGVEGGGTTTIEGSYQVTGTTEILGSNLVFGPGANLTGLGATLLLDSPFANLDLSSGTALSVATLTIDNGILTGSDELTVTTAATMASGGGMLGTGTTVIPSGVTLTLSGSGAKNIGRNLRNEGTVAWTEGVLFGGGVFDNLPGGLFDIQTDGNYNGQPSLTLNNSGTIRKSAGSGVMELRGDAFNVTAAGTVEIQTGTLRSYFTQGTLSGIFTGPAGSGLEVGGGTQTFDGSSSISVANFTASGGGTTAIEGSYQVTGTTLITGSALNFNAGATVTDLGSTLLLDGLGTVDLSSGSPVSVPTLTITAGTLTGSDDLTVTSDLTWIRGTQSGSGRTIIAPGVPVEISGSDVKTLAERTIDNEGVVTWTGTGQIFGGLGAVFNNLGTFDVQNDTTFNGTGGGLPITTFNNAGTLQKTVATGTSTWSVCLGIDTGVRPGSDLIDFTGTCPP